MATAKYYDIVKLTSAMEQLTTSGQELVGIATELQDAVAIFKLIGEAEVKAAKKKKKLK
ncbi:hypothetical protein C5S32_03080, partial [ANME-1 cluster archaeon GoMg1]|nr:hypothetical protein [ANME-1 cluster archaeon GoMg1]